MISPTGKGIRVDKEGDGQLGASRGKRRHRGVDYLCDNGQDIVAPFDFRIVRVAYPKVDLVMKGIMWEFGSSNGRMYYFVPHKDLIGKKVQEGQIIGVAQSVSEYYKLPNMEDHVHFQVNY